MAVLSKEAMRDFAVQRLEANINNIKKGDIDALIQNCIVEKPTWTDTDKTCAYHYIDDGSHAYLIVLPDDKNHSIAKYMHRVSAYNYRLADGTILLEEDEEAVRFLQTIAL